MCFNVIQPKAKCNFEHEPQQDDELHIKEGDIITVLDESDPDWWKGELNGLYRCVCVCVCVCVC